MFTIQDITHHEHAVILVVVMLRRHVRPNCDRVFHKHRNTDMTKMIYFHGVSL